VVGAKGKGKREKRKNKSFNPCPLTFSQSQLKIGCVSPKYVVITISDTGCGIPKAIQERIFEPFFTTKESAKGTGLGLSTVIGIVKNHGGFVNLKSAISKGSQFQVCLPAINTEVTQENSDCKLNQSESIAINFIHNRPLMTN
jgi:signal transduction histidine kinase